MMCKRTGIRRYCDLFRYKFSELAPASRASQVSELAGALTEAVFCFFLLRGSATAVDDYYETWFDGGLAAGWGARKP